LLLVMDGTVNLNDEISDRTEEDNDVRSDRLLAAKTVTAEATAAKVLPEDSFRRSRAPPKLTSSCLRPSLARRGNWDSPPRPIA
jgi:hypothetical protein